MESINKELIEEKFKVVDKNIDSLNIKVNELEKIYRSMQEIVFEIKELRKDTNSIDARLTEIEKEPAAKWKATINSITSLVVGAVVTFILIKIGLK